MKGEHLQQGFLTLNSAAKVPVLINEGRAIIELPAILLYLAEKYPQADFIPESVEKRAQMYRWRYPRVSSRTCKKVSQCWPLIGEGGLRPHLHLQR